MIGGYFYLGEIYERRLLVASSLFQVVSSLAGKISKLVEALYGDILAFIICRYHYCLFFISQHVRKDLSLIPYSVISYGSSAGFLSIFAFMQQESFIHYSTQTCLCFIGLAFIATILGQTIFNWLLKWMSATVISMSILGETIGTCMLAYFILHETISLQQGLGITVIFIGLVLFLLQPNSNEKHDSILSCF